MTVATKDAAAASSPEDQKGGANVRYVPARRAAASLLPEGTQLEAFAFEGNAHQDKKMVRRDDKKPSIVGARRNDREHLPDSVHPLVAAAHLASSQGEGMTLSPRVAWCTIMQGLAQHVRRLDNTDGTSNSDLSPEKVEAGWKNAVLSHLGQQQHKPSIKRLAALYDEHGEDSSTDIVISRLSAGFVAYRPFSSTPSSLKRHFTPDPPSTEDETSQFSVNVTGDAQEWDSLSRTTFAALSDLGPDPVVESWKRKLVPTLATVAISQRRRMEAEDEEEDAEISDFWKRTYKYVYSSSPSENPAPRAAAEDELLPQPCFSSPSSAFVSCVDDQPLITGENDEAAKTRAPPKFSGWLTHFFPYTRDGKPMFSSSNDDDESDDKGAVAHEDLHPGYAGRLFVERDASSGKTRDVYAVGGTVGVTVTIDEDSRRVLYEPTLGWACGSFAQPREIPSNKLGSMFIHDTDKIRDATHAFFEELIGEGVYAVESRNGYPQFLTRLNQELGAKHGLPKNSVSIQAFKEAKRDFDALLRNRKA